MPVPPTPLGDLRDRPAETARRRLTHVHAGRASRPARTTRPAHSADRRWPIAAKPLHLEEYLGPGRKSPRLPALPRSATCRSVAAARRLAPAALTETADERDPACRKTS